MIETTAEQIAQDEYVVKHQRELRQYLGTYDAAEYIGLSVHTLRYHVRQGNVLPDNLIGQNWAFSRDTLDKFVARKRPPGRPRGSRVIGQVVDE